MQASPRRGLPPEPESWWTRTRIASVGSLALAVSLLLVSWLIWGARPGDEIDAVPEDSTTSEPTAPSGSATPVESPAPGSTPDQSSSATPAPTQTVETPQPVPTPQRLELNDATFTAPADWVVYVDELIEDDRRLVQLRNDATDSRLQVVTLVETDPDLASSCRALVASQQQTFDSPSEQLAQGIALDSDEGEGITCGFAGVRSSDQLANTVSFTLLRRNSDGHVLLIRQTVPDSLAAGSLARRQLSTMSCQASTSFGIPLPLC